MNKANADIRTAAKEAGFHLWQIADAYGITDSNFTRKLRRELPPQEKEKIFGIIRKLSSEVTSNA